jgi:outer membrane receptor protein involved in Fe transport
VPLSSDTPLQIEMRPAGPGTTITVTAESGTFRSADASSATKMEIPIREIPQGIGVVDQSLIQSQQDTHFADAAENTSGVYRDVLAAGDVGNALTIRGLPLGVFSSYFEDGFVFDGMVPTDSTDVERIEVLKGPSSVLYGRVASDWRGQPYPAAATARRTVTVFLRPVRAEFKIASG